MFCAQCSIHFATPPFLAASVWALIFITMSNAISWDKRRDMFLSSFIWAFSPPSPLPTFSTSCFRLGFVWLCFLLSPILFYFIYAHARPASCLPISLLFIISLKCDTFLRVCLQLIPPSHPHSRPTFYVRPSAISLYFVWFINNLRWK